LKFTASGPLGKFVAWMFSVLPLSRMLVIAGSRPCPQTEPDSKVSNTPKQRLSANRVRKR
jgi:hypothetical protein